MSYILQLYAGKLPPAVTVITADKAGTNNGEERKITLSSFSWKKEHSWRSHFVLSLSPEFNRVMT